MIMSDHVPAGEDWFIQPRNRNLFRLQYIYFKDGREAGKYYKQLSSGKHMQLFYEMTPLCVRACVSVCVCVRAGENTNGRRSLHSHDNDVCHVHKIC